MVVVDSSLLVNAFGSHGPLGVRSRLPLSGQELVAPFHIDLETLSAWRRQLRQGELSPAQADEAVEALRQAPLRRIPHEPLLSRIWELRANVTTADAAYVAMAEELSVPLLTADAKLTRAPGTRCQFQLID